jgi:hypothetical protein
MLTRRQTLKGLLAACVVAILPKSLHGDESPIVPDWIIASSIPQMKSKPPTQFMPFKPKYPRIGENRQATLETIYAHWIDEVPEPIG